MYGSETSPMGENQPEERVVVLNAFTVIPSTRYQIFQNNRLIKSFLDPDVEVVLKHTESVNIEIGVFPESGKSEKRNSPSHADEDDSFHTYNLGTFNAGDRIEITISKEGQKKEILVPRRVLKVRPGSISLRAGIMAIPKDNRFMTPVSVSMRFFRREKIWRFGGALGLGCGFGISVNKESRVYTFGIQVESFDTVDITFGGAFWKDSTEEFKKSYYYGVTFDIRFFRKIVDTVAGGLTL